VRGAREHNLKNIDVDIPIDKLTVITGLSGSGKSTLAFDTIYAEGQRRYVESLSAYARQFLGLMNKPDVDSIHGLSPAISIEQKTTHHNPRSTVATVTEIYDYLRLLYARVGIPHCPNCGDEIKPQSAEQIVEILTKEKAGAKLEILAPIARGRKGAYEEKFKELHRSGFVRILVDGEFYDLSDWQDIKLDKQKKHDISVIIDRFVMKDFLETKQEQSEQKNFVTRLTSAVEQAGELSGGLVIVLTPLAPPLAKGGIKEGYKERIFSQKLACAKCGISYEEMQPRLFSFNSPFGACPECHGLGAKLEFDQDLVVPNKDLSLNEGAIKPWRTQLMGGYRGQLVRTIAKAYGFSMDTPWKNLLANIKYILLYGSEEKFKFDVHSKTYESNFSYLGMFEGVIKQMERHYRQTESEERKRDIEKYMSNKNCAACQGQRLKPEALAVTINDVNIFQTTEMSIDKARDFFSSLKLTATEQKIAKLILKEVNSRLTFLLDVGLNYLTLGRAAGTLSGGEAQRIRLATQIGSELRGVLYILDEPSIGLHQRDNQKLINTLKHLRELGNTVIVVEHDEETMMSADYIIDLGPGAGVHGGQIVAEGTPEQVKKNNKSLTGQYLAHKIEIPLPPKRRAPKDWLEIRGASEHNLKNIDVKIPLSVFTCVTGVSGSGKSTLVNEILYKSLLNKLHKGAELFGEHKEIIGLEKVNKIIAVDQSPIGRTPRSNPVTYIGVWNYIRELFAALPEAKARGYKPGRFSFNVHGGRCEECEGDGVKKIEMHFLPDVFVVCEKCKGKRFNNETLQVKYKDKNIAEVLAMTVEEGLIFFEAIPAVRHKFQTLFDVGLGYIKLGQSSTTLSGGEAQRVKLTTELAKRGNGNILYVLDEPTTGLHFADVSRLLSVLNKLVDKGNTIIVIEHNLDVIKSADYIIDLGPEGGDKGGEVVACGTPEEVVKLNKGYTAQYLSKYLK
ncbi:excinuclease ABC subunit UvrA, partial [Candidatus Falkowbacteria bacterium CG10_big_fil_rev_8_21_14_0_10_43_11]